MSKTPRLSLYELNLGSFHFFAPHPQAFLNLYREQIKNARRAVRGAYNKNTRVLL